MGDGIDDVGSTLNGLDSGELSMDLDLGGRGRRMERFVQFIIGGGISLVAGLWVVTVGGRWSVLWFVGVVLVLLGIGGLGWGIRRELEY